MKEKDLNNRIVNEIYQRLEKGRQTYGTGILDSDKRDWLQEAIEEALDQCVYLTAQLIRIREKSNGKDI